jgi:chorismate lyase / 3-hydroxybenzoate synthase
MERAAWQGSVLGGRPILHARGADGVRAVAATVPHAATLGRAAFERAVTDVYVRVLAEVARAGCHPLRFWNFVPGINDEIEPGLSRYMAFNAARRTAYAAVHDAPGALPAAIATASGVGAPDRHFHLFGVATRERVMPVENPRQVPAYYYSPRYGPLPPCFARAALTLGGRPMLVVGGTASVRGEDSLHPGNLDAQLEETLVNLRTLIGAACAAAGYRLCRNPLAAFVDLRAYVVIGASASRVREVLAGAAGVPLDDIEVRVADLCRPELLVEVEGLAMVDRVASAH